MPKFLAPKCGVTKDPNRISDKCVILNCVTEGRYDTQKKEAPTIYFDAVFGGKQADYIEKWCQKGTQVSILGDLQIREYTKKDKSNGFGLQVTFPEIELIHNLRKKEDVETSNQKPEGDSELNEDIPF